MTTRKTHTLITSALVGSGLLLACVDNGHVVGDAAQDEAGGEAGSESSAGAGDGSGGSDRQDGGGSSNLGVGGETDGRGGDTSGTGGATPGAGGVTAGTGGSTPGSGGTGGSTPGSGGTGGSAPGSGGTGGSTPGSGGSTPGTGGTGGTGGVTAGAGGSTPGSGGSATCSISGGGNLSILLEDAEQYACCDSDDACHVVYSNCTCAAVSTQVSELVQAIVCDTNTCTEPPGRNAPTAVCDDGQCTLHLDIDGAGGTGGSTTGGTGGTGGSTTGGAGGSTECVTSNGGNLSIPYEQAEQYACCDSDEACHILYTSCGCAAVSTQVSEFMPGMICGTNECIVSGRNPPRAVCESGRCTRVFDYACTGTLAEVTSLLGTDCPATYDSTDAWLESCEGVSSLPWTAGYSGSCDGFSVAQVSWGTHGQICYYDGTSDELVGAVVSEDFNTYCEGTTSMMAGGEYPTECPFTELTYRGACNCNDLENVGTDVTPVDTNDSMPAGQGGDFPFATWVLTDVRTYAGSSLAGALPVMRQTLMTMGGDGLFVGLEDGATTHKAFEYTLDGTAIDFTTTCTTNDSSEDIPYSSFTSDGMTLTLYSPSYGMSVTYEIHSG